MKIRHFDEKGLYKAVMKLKDKNYINDANFNAVIKEMDRYFNKEKEKANAEELEELEIITKSIHKMFEKCRRARSLPSNNGVVAETVTIDDEEPNRSESNDFEYNELIWAEF